MTPVESLPNIGQVAAEMLRSVNLDSVEDVQTVGPLAAYLMVASKHRVSRNLLWALAAGLQDRDWRDLTQQEKTELQQQLDEMA
jgi:nucleotidyltransferase/DNA polymerase involved in DNA repair